MARKPEIRNLPVQLAPENNFAAARGQLLPRAENRRRSSSRDAQLKSVAYDSPWPAPALPCRALFHYLALMSNDRITYESKGIFDAREWFKEGDGLLVSARTTRASRQGLRQLCARGVIWLALSLGS